MGVYTPNLGLYKPDIGETDWGDKVNNNWDVLDAHKHLNVVKVTADYNAKDGDVVLVDASAGEVTVYLPTPSPNAIVLVKKIDNSLNSVNINAGVCNIDGEPTKTINTQFESYMFISDGENWYIF